MLSDIPKTAEPCRARLRVSECNYGSRGAREKGTDLFNFCFEEGDEGVAMLLHVL